MASRWDEFTTPELRQLCTGDIGPELDAELAGAFEARIETLAGASPWSDEEEEAILRGARGEHVVFRVTGEQMSEMLAPFAGRPLPPLPESAYPPGSTPLPERSVFQPEAIRAREVDDLTHAIALRVGAALDWLAKKLARP